MSAVKHSIISLSRHQFQKRQYCIKPSNFSQWTALNIWSRFALVGEIDAGGLTLPVKTAPHNWRRAQFAALADDYFMVHQGCLVYNETSFTSCLKRPASIETFIALTKQALLLCTAFEHERCMYWRTMPVRHQPRWTRFNFINPAKAFFMRNLAMRGFSGLGENYSTKTL